MPQSKHEFFSKGVSEKSKADIVIDLRRVDIKKMKDWTPEQKQQAKDFIERAEKSFQAFKGVLLSAY